MINRNEKFLKIGNIIKENDNFVIVSHSNPDGDAVSSTLGLGLMLKKLGKTCKMILPDPVPEEYDFLPEVETISISRKLPEKMEVLFILDCGDIKRIEFFRETIKETERVVNIDHHYSNNGFGQISYIDETASSVTEILYELFEYLNFEIDRNIALCLYTGILTDTGSFKQENSTAKCHHVVSKLLKFPLKPNLIYSQVYERLTVNQYKILCRGLKTLKLYLDDQVALVYFTKKMFRETNTRYSQVSEFINFIRLLNGIKIAVVCKQKEDSSYRVSLRAKTNVDVSKIAEAFDGGGHPQAAACTLKGEIESVIDRLINKISEFV